MAFLLGRLYWVILVQGETEESRLLPPGTSVSLSAPCVASE